MSDITVIMPSYNKDKYIEEALNSVLSQETSYSYEIIVVDDCSTDKTIEIISDYQKKYPGIIKLLTSNVNQKLFRNVLRAYEITKSKYFCVLDPDDYWIDHRKIQNSLDFLENNPDFTIYATDTIILTPDGKKENYLKCKRVVDATFDDYLNGRAVLGCTLGSVYRNVVFINGIPEKLKTINASQERSFRGDSFRNVLHLTYGKVHYVPDTDGVYRITENGLWQSLYDIERNNANAIFYIDVWKFLDKKYDKLLMQSYGLFQNANRKVFENLLQIDDFSRLRKVLSDMKALSDFYRCNLDKEHMN